MGPDQTDRYLVDLALARRLERAEARANAEFVEARASAYPDSGATWIDVAGAFAMYDGVGSPCTQTFGLGMFDTVSGVGMDKLEAFFQERGAEVFHEVCPLAEASLLRLLTERGYQPVEFSSVLYQPIRPEAGAGGLGRPWTRPDADARPTCNETISVRLIKPGEEELWAQTVSRGWSDVAPEYTDYLLTLGKITAHRRNAPSFVVEKEGQMIAAGALCLSEGVALLAGACTVPQWRKQGAQRALLEHRLRYGALQGCDIAMMVAQPGSASQRNAERQGFRIAYTRVKWRLNQAGGIGRLEIGRS
jgi:GNAT superfamily N-acetyltransferase